MHLARRLFPILVCGLVTVVVHALVWMRISPVTDLGPATMENRLSPVEETPSPAPAAFGDSWPAHASGAAAGQDGGRTSVKLIRSVRFLLLEGTVATNAERARVEEAVRGAEPEMQVRNRIRVDSTAGTAPWLVGFPEWWPRLKERVSDPEIDAWGDPPVCRLWGEVPNEADVDRLRYDFMALMGGGTEVDCVGLRWKGGQAPSSEPVPAEAGEGESWVMVVMVKDGVLVAGRAVDATLGDRLADSLAGRGGRIDVTDLHPRAGSERESWGEGLPDVVRSMAALSGDGILEIRQGEAWLAARVRSPGEGAGLDRAVRELLEGRLRVRTEIFSPDGTRFGLREPDGGLTVYFGVGKTDVPEFEKRKIARFAEGTGALDGGGVIRVIAYASGAEPGPEADAEMARRRAEAVLGAIPAAMLERYRPEIETRRPGWSEAGVVFRQDQRVELEVLRLH